MEAITMMDIACTLLVASCIVIVVSVVNSFVVGQHNDDLREENARLKRQLDCDPCTCDLVGHEFSNERR